jgi:hypothetical protein
VQTRHKLTIVAFGLLACAIGLVVSTAPRFRRPAAPPVRLVAELGPMTAAEKAERRKLIDGVRENNIESHGWALKYLLQAEDAGTDDLCGNFRLDLRNSIELYAERQSADFDNAISQSLMSENEMTEMWSTPEDARAIRQANGRFQHGLILRNDLRDERIDYSKLFSIPDDVEPACPGPIVVRAR